MRRLWITRHKAAAASTVKMKVYIEDLENGDTFIQDTLCRELGELKNNQKKHFSIGENAAKVYVVADQLNHNGLCAFADVPEGREDVFLSGRNHFQPSAGNPFRFDGAEHDQIREEPRQENPREERHREKPRGKGLVAAVILIGILSGAVIGVVISAFLLKQVPVQEAKVYSCQGMQIALGEAFEEQPAAGFAACYANAETAVRIAREEFSLREGLENLSLEEYRDQLLDANGLDASALREEENGLPAFSYTWTDPNTEEQYVFYNVLLKGPDAFWTVQFSAPRKDARDREDVFRRWAGTIAFDA